MRSNANSRSNPARKSAPRFKAAHPMAERYMLDTNILIYLIKNKPPSVAQRINALGA